MTMFIAVYDHHWGSGESVVEARKAARAAGGRGDRWYVNQLPEHAVHPYVDDFGGINWRWDDDGQPEDYDRNKPLPIVKYGRGATDALRCSSCKSRYEAACKSTCEYEKAAS